TAVRPYTGYEVWRLDEAASTIPSTAQSGGVLYAPLKGLSALAPAAAGQPPQALWQENKMAPGTPSPLVEEGRVYSINGAGVLVCADAKSGKIAWQLRLQVPLGEKTSRGVFTSTPIAAAGHLYIFNEDGVALVVKAAVQGGESGEIVASHDFGEIILCTPAIADGALYVRSDKHLWKVGRHE
ncbi:MAG TPA: PQQ-binding-like beta-propeller repeat protein, partial [Pirellulaceae bacterium]|nr:PQQ-binding-like beta-propeller repeat protein [Pirellulaceae bacterium]